MLNTFAERLVDAMKGPPKVTGVALAKACGVKPPSVSDWRTGASKSPEGSHLLAAAKKLGVRPEWLADGVGPKHPDAVPTGAIVARETGPDTPWGWPFKTVKPKQYSLLDDDQRADVEKYIRLQLKTHSKSKPVAKHKSNESPPAPGLAAA